MSRNVRAVDERLRLSAAAARQLTVAAQALDRRPRRRARKEDVLAAIRQMGALQIDTINVVARSPYLVLWSRLGAYDPSWLDELLAEGVLFEYWAHEASFVPIEDFALFRHRMIDPGSMGWKYSHAWLEKHTDVVASVRAKLREHGPVRSADFERKDGRANPGWWGWKPEKRALEMLFTAGEVMVARRERFQRVYDLRERVLPIWDDAQLAAVEETDQRLAEQAVRALGIMRPRWVADYYRMGKQATARALHALQEQGVLQTVDVDGWPEAGLIHREGIELAARAADGRLRPALTTILSPFDPLVWDRARARAVFDFDYRLECYTPAAKRVFGYFVLPILRRGRLIGRLDAKAHRSAGRFEVKTLYLEDSVRVEAGIADDIATALAELAVWHGTPRVAVTRTKPSSFAQVLRRALRAKEGAS